MDSKNRVSIKFTGNNFLVCYSVHVKLKFHYIIFYSEKLELDSDFKMKICFVFAA